MRYVHRPRLARTNLVRLEGNSYAGSQFRPTHFRDNYVSKPLLSRDGANITIHQNGTVTEHEGTYDAAGTIFQELAQIPCLGGNYPVFGSWVICGEPAGIGICEDASRVNTNMSRFVLHLFR